MFKRLSFPKPVRLEFVISVHEQDLVVETHVSVEGQPARWNRIAAGIIQCQQVGQTRSARHLNVTDIREHLRRKKVRRGGRANVRTCLPGRRNGLGDLREISWEVCHHESWAGRSIDGVCVVSRTGRSDCGVGERLAESERRTTELERKLAEVTRESQRHAGVQRLAKHLRHQRHEWFLFLYAPDIPATNNHAEHQLRPGVILRKQGSCHRKPLHAVAHEITASLTATCRQRGHPFLELAKQIWLSPQPRAFPVSK
jgi:hypothetical protein